MAHFSQKWWRLTFLVWILALLSLFASEGTEAARKKGTKKDTKPNRRSRSSPTIRTGETIIQALDRLESGSPNHIIPMDFAFFLDITLAPDKNFSIVTMASTEDEAACSYCKDVNKYTAACVDMIRRHAPNGRIMDAQGYPVYFVMLDALKERRIAQIMQLDSVPRGFLVTPKNLQCQTDHANEPLTVERLRETKASSIAACELLDRPVSSADAESSWFRLRQHRNAFTFGDSLFKWISNPDTANAIMAAAGREQARTRMIRLGIAVLIVGASCLYGFDYIRATIIKHRSVVAVLGLLSYWISTSGLIFSIQNGFMLYGHGRSGETVWVSRQPRTQFALEGIFYAALTCVFSFCFYLAMRMHSLLIDPLKNKAQWKKITAVVLSGIFLASAYLLWTLVTSGVLVKQPFLRPSFWPDSSFVYGSHRRDRGYAF